MIVNITGKLIINYRAKDWCKLKYPGHRKGCPNTDTCKERLVDVGDYFDLTKEYWFVVQPFNIRKQMERMFDLHPRWSDRQARCCLYWQDYVRKLLFEQTERFIIRQGEGLRYTLIPEGMGVNVFKTCHEVGIPIERNPETILYKIAMVGYDGRNRR